MIAGFRCQDGIVICADTQETLGSVKRNVSKLEFTKGPTWSTEQNELINHDLAFALCGAGHGPFVDKIASRAWNALRGVFLTSLHHKTSELLHWMSTVDHFEELRQEHQEPSWMA